MPTNFPTSLDALTNPTSTDSLASPDHADQHSNVNDAVEALQAKVGVNGSSVTTTIDYKLAQFTGGTTNQVLKKTSNTDFDLEWGESAPPTDDANNILATQIFG